MNTPTPIRLVADLGNSRLKLGRLGPGGALDATVALPMDEPSAWAAALESWGGGNGARWAVSTVNPPVAERLGRFIEEWAPSEVIWYRTAAEVPLANEVEGADTGGSDRALAVVAALARHGGEGPGLVVSCGTAITVERVAPSGSWQGGAIAPSMKLAALALRLGTAQLPLIQVNAVPESWGRSAEPAMAAGLFWGAIGTVRELLMRQTEGLEPSPWHVWSGGDAPLLAPWVDGPGALVVPELVLEGVARVAFGCERGP
ncbi:MAG TPA: type III pantothenate kinase [Isosphaeraceae bacterium]|jgi:type III pantothenate kinase|nr:type III pantothenate kinase [Isosphaeraceae bacterium]